MHKSVHIEERLIALHKIREGLLFGVGFRPGFCPFFLGKVTMETRAFPIVKHFVILVRQRGEGGFAFLPGNFVKSTGIRHAPLCDVRKCIARIFRSIFVILLGNFGMQ